MKKAMYKIFPEAKIIIEYLSGTINWLVYLEMKKHELTNPGYNPGFNVITDIRNADMDGEEELVGIDSYVEFLKANNAVIGHRKTAILTSNSRQVVNSEILKVMISRFPMELRTVSTYHAAFEWTELNYINQSKIGEYLEKLSAKSLEQPVNTFNPANFYREYYSHRGSSSSL